MPVDTKAGVFIFESGKIDSKSKIAARKKDHDIMTKMSIHQEYIKILNKYIPNIGIPKYIKQILANMNEK